MLNHVHHKFAVIGARVGLYAKYDAVARYCSGIGENQSDNKKVAKMLKGPTVVIEGQLL